MIERDKIVVPPNWDSWGKIRVLREGFDVERVSNGWSIDLAQPFPAPPQLNGTTTTTTDTTTGSSSENGGQANDDGDNSNSSSANDGDNDKTAQDGHGERTAPDPEGSTVVLYEEAVQDPTMDALQLAGRATHSTELEVETIDTQTFLAQQLKVLEAFRQKNEEASRESARQRQQQQQQQQQQQHHLHHAGRRHDDDHLVGGGDAAEAKVLEHIGPVQFNMGGIQVDADDMVQRLKVSQPLFFFFFFSPKTPQQFAHDNCAPTQERQAYGSSPEPGSPTTASEHAAAVETTPHMDTENLQAFFHGLMNRRGAAAK